MMKGQRRDGRCPYVGEWDCAELFFLAVAVAAHDLIHTAGGVDEFLLAGEEGVRGACDFKLHEGICNAINFDCFFSSDS